MLGSYLVVGRWVLGSFLVNPDGPASDADGHPAFEIPLNAVSKVCMLAPASAPAGTWRQYITLSR